MVYILLTFVKYDLVLLYMYLREAELLESRGTCNIII